MWVFFWIRNLQLLNWRADISLMFFFFKSMKNNIRMNGELGNGVYEDSLNWLCSILLHLKLRKSVNICFSFLLILELLKCTISHKLLKIRQVSSYQCAFLVTSESIIQLGISLRRLFSPRILLCPSCSSHIFCGRNKGAGTFYPRGLPSLVTWSENSHQLQHLIVGIILTKSCWILRTVTLPNIFPDVICFDYIQKRSQPAVTPLKLEVCCFVVPLSFFFRNILSPSKLVFLPCRIPRTAAKPRS